MSRDRSAELAVVLVTDTYRTIRKVVELLRAQTIAPQLELVFVAPSEESFELPSAEVAAFAGVTVIAVRTLDPIPAARAAGIRAASAPLVALMETHVYPEPGWAEALVEAHRSDWAGVGPAFANANPRSTLGWASLLMDYGPWIEPTDSGVVANVPSNNSCYKRALLVDQGSGLEAGMGFGPELHAVLQTRGHQLYLESSAKVAHLNASRLSPWAADRFLLGRWLAGDRAGRWPAVRRVAYAGGSPVIALVRLRRILRDARRPIREHRLLPRVLPALGLGIVIATIGELVGFLLGPGNAARRVTKYDIRKVDCVRESDRVGLI